MGKYSVEGFAAKARQTVGEGIVLLRNEGAVLPFGRGTRISVFGRAQFNYYKSGTGSGGLVNAAYVTGILDALMEDGHFIVNQELKGVYEGWLKQHPFDKGHGWGTEPWAQEEMPLARETAEEAKKASDAAIVILGRTAGEDQDNKAEPGSYLLTETEEKLLETVCGVFERTVVLLNVGNIIDMKWVEKYGPGAVAYVWQGGQEGGNSVADVLSGRVNPSGKLPDTVAMDIHDYPSTRNFGNDEENIYAEDIYVGYRYFETFAKEKVLYPFGFGLSYTDFHMETELSADCGPGGISVRTTVTNVGKAAGKEVVQVYVSAPQGRLGKPSRSLVGFSKTRLLEPGESHTLEIPIQRSAIASYDAAGATGHRSCWVLEEGRYDFYVGGDVRSAAYAGSFDLGRTEVAEQLEEAMAPTKRFEILRPVERNGALEEGYEPAPTATADMTKRILEELPVYPDRTEGGWLLADVAKGRVSMAEFVNQLTDEELVCLVRGEGMCSPKGTPGVAGVFGGVTESLAARGIPVASCSDGPSGIRMDCGTPAFAMPNGACLAATFNEEQNRELYEWEGLELRKNKIDTLLGPGMNIHRNPLNGRNFEYFSEDPLLTGRIAAAQLRGMQKYQVTGTVKHFACNNQEWKRNFVEALVSERALREIYLKGFEIAVKEGGAHCLMTSYNPINGFWAASNYDLLTTILRKEWGYEGVVMTDWWAKGNFAGEAGEVSNTGAKAAAQNDLNMVNVDALGNSGKDNSTECLKDGRAVRAQYLRCGENICRFIMGKPVFDRMLHGESPLDKELESFTYEGEERVSRSLECRADGNGVGIVEGRALDTAKGALNLITVTVPERGIYRIELCCRAASSEGELAQIPVSVIRDKELLETITVVGSEKEWRTHVIRMKEPLYGNHFYLKLFFGQGGMEVRELRLVMLESYEERFRR